MPNEPWPAGDRAVVAREVIVAGERVRIVESGVPGNFPVVLLHGWGASAYNFRGILGSLGRAGYHAIAPDSGARVERNTVSSGRVVVRGDGGLGEGTARLPRASSAVSLSGSRSVARLHSTRHRRCHRECSPWCY